MAGSFRREYTEIQNAVTVIGRLLRLEKERPNRDVAEPGAKRYLMVKRAASTYEALDYADGHQYQRDTRFEFQREPRL